MPGVVLSPIMDQLTVPTSFPVAGGIKMACADTMAEDAANNTQAVERRSDFISRAGSSHAGAAWRQGKGDLYSEFTWLTSPHAQESNGLSRIRDLRAEAVH